jgi:queuine tRNA-ribosyltransferase
MLGSMLASYHNIYYYHELMKQIRQSIDDDIFVNFAKDFYNSRNLPIPDYLEGL